MGKPQDYREQRIVSRDTNYKVQDGAQKGSHASSGTLATGRVVWIRKKSPPLDEHPSVSAYAEGIGLISVAPECLYA